MHSIAAMTQTNVPNSYVVLVSIDCWQFGHVVCMGSGGNMEYAPLIAIGPVATTTVGAG